MMQLTLSGSLLFPHPCHHGFNSINLSRWNQAQGHKNWGDSPGGLTNAHATPSKGEHFVYFFVKRIHLENYDLTMADSQKIIGSVKNLRRDGKVQQGWQIRMASSLPNLATKLTAPHRVRHQGRRERFEAVGWREAARSNRQNPPQISPDSSTGRGYICSWHQHWEEYTGFT